MQGGASALTTQAGWVLANGIESQTSVAALPAVLARQLLRPLKLNDWFSAKTALANSVSSLTTALRTATSPTIEPRTRMVATNTHSVAIKAPQSSFHNLSII